MDTRDWLHDLEGNDTGMIRRNGSAKPVWHRWQEFATEFARSPRAPLRRLAPS